MKQIRQTSLYMKDGRYEKIFHVELCLVSDNEYLVNFRFGRLGGRLQDGTKTIFPVDLPTAETVYDKLIGEKLGKGYIRREDLAQAKVPETHEPRPKSGKLEDDLLNRLALARDGKYTGNWKLSRVIWRAGELKLAEAFPCLIDLAGHGDDMQKYCVAWAIGRCAGENSPRRERAIAVLVEYHTGAYSDAVRRIAAEGICRLQKSEHKEEFVRHLVGSLPAELGKAVSEDSYEAVRDKLNEYLFKLKTASNEYLATLYLISQERPNARRALVEALAGIPFKPNFFKPVRHIYKAAEFREDAEVCGLLSHRFEKTAPFYTETPYGRSYVGNRYVNTKKEKKKKDPEIAWSDRTRNHFRKRAVRMLKRTGRAGDPKYTEMAGGILLPFTDGDAGKPYYLSGHTYDSDWQYVGSWTTHYDAYSEYLAFNFILYGNSPRYELKPGAKSWSCRQSWEPGNPVPETREESFPELWDAAPSELLNLLDKSRCLPVHEFAVKAFGSLPDFENHAGVEHIIFMLERPYGITNRLGLELAEKKYSQHDPDKSLVSAMIRASLEEARNTAKKWIEQNPRFFVGDTEFACGLIVSRHKDVRDWTRSLVSGHHFAGSDAEALIARVVSDLMALAPEDGADDLARDAGEILLIGCPDALKEIGPDILSDMISHPLSEVRLFAGKVLLRRRAEEIPEKLLSALLGASSEPVRAIGVQILGKWPDSKLLERRSILIGFCISEFESVRRAVKPIVGRLAAANSEFAEETVGLLYSAFLFKESAEGVHDDLFSLFTGELAGALAVIDRKTGWRMLRSKHPRANSLGLFLFEKCFDISELTIREAVEMANHEMLGIRKFARDHYQNNVGTIKEEKKDALGILDSDWDDTRLFAFDFFRNRFESGDWTPELLVGLCDSVREDVRAFGREMITAFFEEARGSEYLLKLSQHPSADLQLFASNWLERYASDDIDKITQLEPYFTTVLSQVNRARVAKTRVLAFLGKEALKNENAARVAVRILTRMSLTIAKGDKAACIETLLEIYKRYPDIETPIEVRPVRVYTSH